MTTYVTGQQTRTALLDSQRRVLERIASGAPLQEILETLVRLIEEQAFGMRCAVLLADTAQQRLRFAAAPSIPEDYKEGIDPFLRIAPNMGSCATAAFLRKPVYTQDTETDPLWRDCRDIAVRNGLRAIWSTPILSDDNAVLGTFAMYYGEPRLPSPEHMQLIDMATQMARVAIEAKGNEELLRTVFECAPEGMGITDLAGNIIRVNPAFARLIGYTEAELQGKTIADVSHEDDYPHNQALIDELLAGKRPHFVIDKRYRRKGGEIIWVHNTVALLRGPAEEPRYMVALVKDISERKRAEQAALRMTEEIQTLSRQKEDHLRLVIDTIPTMAWSVRPDGVVDFLNKRWVDYSGLTLERYVQDPTGPIHAEDIPRVLKKWRATMAAGESSEDEMRLRRADGEYRWFLVRTVPLRDEQGNIVKWYGTSTDIEDRKRAEDALRESEERFAAFMNNLPGYAWMKDLQGRYVYINQMVRGLPGYQSLGKTDAQIWPADLAAEYRANDRQVIAAKKPFHTVEHYLHEGKQRWMVGSKFPIFDKTGAVALVGGAGVDITERIEAEEALRESEHRLRTILRTAMDGFWRTDVQGRFLEVNEAYCRMSAYSEQELLAMSISDVEAQEIPSEVVAHIRSIMVQGEGRFESRHRRKDGSIFPVEVSAQYRRTPDGGQMVAFLRDITERKQAGDALRQLAEELQALSRRLVELQESERRGLARELHDRVGQGLTALSINLGILKGLVSHDSAEAGSRLADSAALVKSTVRAIENVVSELRPPMLEDFGLMAALRWYATEFSLRTGVAVSVGGKEPRARISADIEIALYRIVQEALNNVAKHAHATTVAIVLGRSGSEYEMSVTDDGVGFRTADLRAHPSRPGLGMVTMRERAQAVGGRFEVMALPGNGTRLTVRVPV